MKKLLFLLILLMGCSKTNYKEIMSSEAYKMIKEDEVIILDVRTESEYKSGHLIDAINIPYEEIKIKIENVVKDKNKSIIVYCKSGSRALIASEMLIDLGYEKVYTFGGINDWKYEIE